MPGGGYNFTRFSIVQFPVVSTILSVVQIVLHLVDIDEYYKHIYTFLAISIISILLYLIAFSLLVNLIEPKFPDSKIAKKFKYLRLVVLVIKIQIQILEAIFRGVDIQCNDFPGEAWSLLNLVKQPLIVVQMIVLAFATWTVYRKETKLNIASSVS
ncbi:AAEL003884-PA [Aedes aegypti]|uniref:AAEL003884-PA n=1 Tax=Aedes aegypti TaxID=7159 RepID=Q17EA5_AEDAE|nr:AAEL003884-PA [Aedes aegypti]